MEDETQELIPQEPVPLIQEEPKKRWSNKEKLMFLIIIVISLVCYSCYYQLEEMREIALHNWNVSNEYELRYSNAVHELNKTFLALEQSRNRTLEEYERYKACSEELNQFKGSPGYYYSRKIIIDAEVKSLASDNIEDFKDREACLSWEDQYVCLIKDPFGNCIKGYWNQVCISEDAGKTLFNKIQFGDWQSQYAAQAIFANYYYVRDNINYALGASPDSGTAQTSKETLEIGAGKCDEMSILLVSMLRSVGLTAFLYSVPLDNHMVVAVAVQGLPGGHYEGDGYLLLDPTCKWCDIDEFPEWDMRGAQTLDYFKNLED